MCTCVNGIISYLQYVSLTYILVLHSCPVISQHVLIVALEIQEEEQNGTKQADKDETERGLYCVCVRARRCVCAHAHVRALFFPCVPPHDVFHHYHHTHTHSEKF